MEDQFLILVEKFGGLLGFCTEGGGASATKEFLTIQGSSVYEDMIFFLIFKILILECEGLVEIDLGVRSRCYQKFRFLCNQDSNKNHNYETFIKPTFV